MRMYRFNSETVCSVFDAIMANVVFPYVALCLTFTIAFGVALVWVTTPGVAVYIMAAISALVCECLLMAIITPVLLAHWLNREDEMPKDTDGLVAESINDPEQPPTQHYWNHVSDIPSAVRVTWWVITLLGTFGLIAASWQILVVDGWTADFALERMVPKKSYLYTFGSEYDKYYAGVPLPINLPITGVDFGDHNNGPGLVELANRIKKSPIINATSFRNWYEAYTEYCKAGALCKDTMINGFPTNASYNSILFFTGFLLDSKYSMNAADIKLCYNALGIPEFCGIAKFGGETVSGGVASYRDQTNLADDLHTLTVTASKFLCNTNDSKENCGVYAYSSPFPYFEQWKPARDDLWHVLMSSIVAAVVLGAVTLDTWALLATLVMVVNGILLVFFVTFIGMESDLNLVTAVGCFMLVPVVFSLAYLPALRYSNAVVIAMNTKSSPIESFMREAMCQVYLPSSVSYIIVTCGGMLFYLGCESPINIQFFKLFISIMLFAVTNFIVVWLPWIDVLSMISRNMETISRNSATPSEA